MRPIFVTFRTPKKFYLYDRNRNSILEVLKEDFESLNHMNSNENFESTLKRYQDNGFLVTDDLRNIIHPESDLLEYRINNCMHQLTLQLTQDCNLRCSYCAYSGNYNQRDHNKKRMTLETAKRAIDFLLEHSKDQSNVNIAFYGGEPLLEKKLLKESVKYAEERFDQKKISFSTTTNGTLLNDEIVEFFIEHDISVMVSLDGPRDIHDLSRKFANGQGTFDVIMENINRIREKYPEFFNKINFNIVLNPKNNLKCTDDFFNAQDVIQSEYVNRSFLAENYAKEQPMYDELFFAESSYEKFKLYLWLLGKISKKNVSKLFIQDFGKIKQAYDFMIPIPNLPQNYHPSGPCLPGVRRPFVTVDGNILPCERVSETSEIMNIGDIYDGIDLEKANNILNIGKVSEDECKQCWCLLQCTACAAIADDNIQLSKEKKMHKCHDIKISAIELMKTLCFLKEHNFDMEQSFSTENYKITM